MTSKTWKLKRTSQCQKCPWLVDVDPHDIPNGYCEDRHRALSNTIANQSDVLSTMRGKQKAMACHELEDAHCIGWLHNQLGTGNNIGLRIAMMSCENGAAIRLRGEQHDTFEGTLPGRG